MERNNAHNRKGSILWLNRFRGTRELGRDFFRNWDTQRRLYLCDSGIVVSVHPRRKVYRLMNCHRSFGFLDCF